MPRDLGGLHRQLCEIVGAERVLTGAAAATFAVGGVPPSVVAQPGSQEQVAAVVAAVAAAGAALLPWGGGTAMALGGRPDRLDLVVRLDRLARIVEFDPDNLIVSAEAGVRLGDLQETLAAKRLVLPLDPAALPRRTVGGVLASNASGPTRLLYGTARDLVLGLRVVLASGERIRCGGKVIKNVSGYDMNKLFIGSLGTLGVITEATFKLLPAPVARGMVIGVFPQLAQAAAVATRTLESFLLPEALELLDPAALAPVAADLGVPGATGYALAASLAGSPETVERQVRDLRRFLEDGQAGRTSSVDPAGSAAAAGAVRDVLDRAAGGKARLQLKVSVPISQTPRAFAALEAAGRRQGWPTMVAAHGGSGVIRAALQVDRGAPEAVGDVIDALRREVEAVEGSLVVEAAPPGLQGALDVWGKPGEAFAVMQRVKAEFDPQGVFAAGRFLGRL